MVVRSLGFIVIGVDFSVQADITAYPAFLMSIPSHAPQVTIVQQVLVMSGCPVLSVHSVTLQD